MTSFEKQTGMFSCVQFCFLKKKKYIKKCPLRIGGIFTPQFRLAPLETTHSKGVTAWCIYFYDVNTDGGIV